MAFNLSNDPYLGRLVFVRVLDGTLHEGKALVDVATGGKADIRDLYALEGTKQKRVSSAAAGEVVAIAKAEGVVLGATLGVTQDAAPFKFPEFPRPGFSRTIVPKTQADVEKMSAALKEVAATKMTIEVERDPVTKELTLRGMGDVHLHVIIERLKNRYNVALETRQPRIPYKETIRRKAEAKYRHKKQTGGRGQFGEVYLRVEPYKGEGGFKFVDEIKGASIPNQYVPGVEKGILEALEEGSLAKFPVTDILVAVYDGSFHPVDSSELAFKLAARGAFREAFDSAEPCLLEPDHERVRPCAGGVHRRHHQRHERSARPDHGNGAGGEGDDHSCRSAARRDAELRARPEVADPRTGDLPGWNSCDTNRFLETSRRRSSRWPRPKKNERRAPHATGRGDRPAVGDGGGDSARHGGAWLWTPPHHRGGRAPAGVCDAGIASRYRR